jgi:adenylate kinase
MLFYKNLIKKADSRYKSHLRQIKAKGFMTISLRDKIKQLPIEQQKEIAERATVLIEEETKRQYI